MEGKLNCFSVLSLRETALRRIAVALVNSPEILATTEKLPYKAVQSFRLLWIEILGSRIEDIVSQLPLPASLKKEMIPILKAVGSEILKWKMIHKEYLGEIGLNIVKKLVWTSAGTVDYRKTGDTLVCSDLIGMAQRFELACRYCLDDRIPALWNKLSGRNKKIFCEGRHPSLVDTPNSQLFLPYELKKSYWCCHCPLIRFRRNCFRYSASLGNKTATEYSLEQLSKEKRKPPLSSTALDVIKYRNLIGVPFVATHETIPDVLCYLLSLMTHEEQVSIFKELPDDVLRVFFDWPWQDLCLEIADVVWTFLPESRYQDVHHQIKAHIRRSGFYLPSFIQEFFLRSPVKFRQYFLDEECETVFFFTEFFHAEDSDSIRVIFQNIDALDRETLIFSEKFLTLCDAFLLKGKGRIVEKCIQEAMLSQEVRDRLRVVFDKFVIFRDLTDLNFTFKQSVSRTMKRKRFSNFISGVNTNIGVGPCFVGEDSPFIKDCDEGDNDSFPFLDYMDLCTDENRTDETLNELNEFFSQKLKNCFPFFDRMDTSTPGYSKTETLAVISESCNEKENASFPFFDRMDTSTAENSKDERLAQISESCNERENNSVQTTENNVIDTSTTRKRSTEDEMLQEIKRICTEKYNSTVSSLDVKNNSMK